MRDLVLIFAIKGYLGWEYPAARLLQRLPLAKYSAFCIIAWGLVLCCFAAVKNFSGAVAVRFFLGMLEASVTPGFALFTSQVRRGHLKTQLVVAHFTRSGIPRENKALAQPFGPVSTGLLKSSVALLHMALLMATLFMVSALNPGRLFSFSPAY